MAAFFSGRCHEEKQVSASVILTPMKPNLRWKNTSSSNKLIVKGKSGKEI